MQREVNFTKKEIELVGDLSLKESQLRLFRKVLNNCTPKKEKLLEKKLTSYIIAVKNANSAVESMMKKKGLVRK